MNNTFLVSLILLIGCNSEKPNPFKETKIDRSNFYISDGCFLHSKKPHTLSYVFKGEITNESNQRFKAGVYLIDIQMELDNGNVITQKDKIAQYKAGEFSKILLDIKPGQVVGINRFNSIEIPVEYCTYPVKKVSRVMRCYLVDEINAKEEVYEKAVDVTDKWNQVVKRVEEGKVDCTCFWDFVNR